MRAIRRYARAIGACLMFQMLWAVIAPVQAYALSSQIQPEFAEFESIEGTDMVNLLTGDFQYNVPLLQVPGTDGGFSLPLSYHAGIAMEQDASWVGLGWSLNPGALLRNTSQYPDDLWRGSYTTSIFNQGISGYTINCILYQRTRIGNSLGGSVGLSNVLSVGFGSNTGLSVIGISADNTPAQNVMGVASAALSVYTGGLAGFAKDIATSAVTEVAMGVAVGALTANSSYGASSSDWSYEEKGSSFFGKKSFRYYMDVDREEQVCGALYLQDLPVREHVSMEVTANSTTSPLLEARIFNNNSVFVGSDRHYNFTGGEYAYSLAPTSITYDSYQVQGAGVTGNIQPYRLDVGTLPQENLSKHADSYMPVQWTDTKVQFRYLNTPANGYDHHAYKDGSGAIQQSTGLSFDFNTNGLNGLARVHVNDPKLGVPGSRIEADRTGGTKDGSLTGHKLIYGRNVEWYTNYEMNVGLGASGPSDSRIDHGRIMDHLEPSARSAFRGSKPMRGIGAFAVTGANGVTYHYTLPVMNLRQMSRSGLLSDTTHHQYTYSDEDYAVTWLLTTITGPDFVDRNRNGCADANDWGDWVRFDYGRFSSSFEYRYPYQTNSTDDLDNDFSLTNLRRETFMEGARESYYLNRIHTRTHSALFIKSLRLDGKGDFDRGAFVPRASSSLRLDDIVLLRNADYEHLVSTGGGGLGLGDYSLNTQTSSGSNVCAHDLVRASSDTFSKILDKDDLDQTKKDFIAAAQLLHIHFNYSYALCDGTKNSRELIGYADGINPPQGEVDIADTGGKLTLESISQYGPNEVKLMPDYEFEYGPNPGYDRQKVDGWGMYTSTGGTYVGGVSHNQTTIPGRPNYYGAIGAHEATADGDAWSLTKIITPTGAEIEVAYERDTYSSLNGMSTSLSLYALYNNEVDIDDQVLEVSSNIDLGSYPFLEDTAAIEAGAGFMGNVNYASTSFSVRHDRDPSTIYHAFNGKHVTIPNDHAIHFVENMGWPAVSTPGTFQNVLQEQSRVCLRTSGKYGGDIRVKQLTTRDPFSGQELTTEYRYTKDGTANGISSGACSSEPELSKGADYWFEGYYDLPRIPVMYGTVTVIQNAHPAHSGARTVYEFRTPDYGMVKDNWGAGAYLMDEETHPGGDGQYSQNMAHYNFIMDIRTAGIGDLLSMKSYDEKGFLHETTAMEYTSDGGAFADLGAYTEGSILAERRLSSENTVRYEKFIRTTKRYHPSIPVSVRRITDGLEKTVTNTSYDFMTGVVLGTEYADAWGALYRTRTVPAYKHYPGLGSRAVEYNTYGDLYGANMMGLPAEEYLYLVADGQEKLVDAKIHTFQAYWNYPVYGVGDSFSGTGEIWHARDEYVWKSRLAPDGTYAEFEPFDWNSSTQDPGWQRIARAKQYDVHGRLLESEDINGNSAVTEYGYDDRFVIASGTFASRWEMRYCGAEERGVGATSFASRVSGAGKMVQTNTFSHTGRYAMRLSPEEKGFEFSSFFGIGDPFIKAQEYRISVWVHKHNWQRANLFYKVYDENGSPIANGSGQSLGTSPKFRAGNWYLLELIVPAAVVNNPDAYQLDVGVENIDTELSAGLGDEYVYFDDVRFHPLQSTFTSNVYDEHTGQIIATLDANNLAKRYTYDVQGRLIRTEVETKDGFVRSKEYSYTFARE